MLTHRQVEAKLDRFMEELSWSRVKMGNGMSTFCQPDRMYAKPEMNLLVCEIKPSIVATGEIKRGIGQMACFLPWRVKPYLVIPENRFEDFQKIWVSLPWLGIFSYDEKGCFTLRQKSQAKGSHWLKTASWDIPKHQVRHNRTQ